MNKIREAIKNLPGHWYKGHMTDNKGNYCGLGHVAKAYGFSDDQIDNESFGCDESPLLSDFNLLHEIAGEQYPDRAIDLFTTFTLFNDHPDTTEDEVIALMEKAAVRKDEMS